METAMEPLSEEDRELLQQAYDQGDYEHKVDEQGRKERPAGIKRHSDEYRKRKQAERAHDFYWSMDQYQRTQYNKEKSLQRLIRLENMSPDELAIVRHEACERTRRYLEEKKKRGQVEIDPWDLGTYPGAERELIKHLWGDKRRFNRWRSDWLTRKEAEMRERWGEGPLTEEEAKEEVEDIQNGWLKYKGVFIDPKWGFKWACEEGAELVTAVMARCYDLKGKDSVTWGPHRVRAGDLRFKWLSKVVVCKERLNRARSKEAREEALLIRKRIRAVLDGGV